MSIKLLIADGQEIGRAGLRSFVADTEITVVAEASTGKDAVKLASSQKPNIVLMAVEMGEKGGFWALQRIRRRRPKLPVIMIANRDHPAYFAQTHTLGGAAFLLKEVSRDVLLKSIRAVAAGQDLWIWSQMRRLSTARIRPWPVANTSVSLTSRESQVLCGMVEGRKNLEIATDLGISYETVKEHVQHVLRKIGVVDRTQAAVWAVRNGLA